MTIRKIAGLTIYSLVMALVIIEIILVSMLRVPRLTAATPRPVRRLAQQVYRHFNRSLIQFDPACARYDPQVTYTLKPGTCTFENQEFKTTVRVNHIGVRDDEAALNAPEVIVIGDSHAMGWGVDQEHAIPQQLAKKSGLKVLNAAVSSYGTVRELMMLDRVDTSRLRVLVVQYADNDVLENRAYQQNHGRLPITSEAEYQKIVQHYGSQRSYYPGKYASRLFMKVFRLEEPEPDQTRMEAVSPTEEAELFLNVLAHASRTPLEHVLIVVFEISEQIRPSRPFIAALDKVKRRSTNPQFIRRLIALDVAPRLSTSDFYVLDDHMNRRGHETVADAIVPLVRN